MACCASFSSASVTLNATSAPLSLGYDARQEPNRQATGYSRAYRALRRGKIVFFIAAAIAASTSSFGRTALSAPSTSPRSNLIASARFAAENVADIVGIHVERDLPAVLRIGGFHVAAAAELIIVCLWAPPPPVGAFRVAAASLDSLLVLTALVAVSLKDRPCRSSDR